MLLLIYRIATLLSFVFWTSKWISTSDKMHFSFLQIKKKQLHMKQYISGHKLNNFLNKYLLKQEDMEYVKCSINAFT